MKIICIALKYNAIQIVKYCQIAKVPIKNLRLHFGILQIIYHKLVHLQIGIYLILYRFFLLRYFYYN